jgi:protein gp37
VPARVRFLSVEPLLAPVDLRPYLHGLDWVIGGCESNGSGLGRKCDLDWIRSLRDQCQEAGVAFFLKQADVNGKLDKSSILDGVLWRQMPLSVVHE